jgi:tetratricopeptide (TPR) repeat protein
LIFYQKAQLLYDRGRLHDAETYCKNALARQEAAGNHTDSISTLRLLADIAIEQGDYAAAGAYCERARVASEQTHNLAELAATYYSLAVVARLQSNLQRASYYIGKGMPLFERLGMKAFTALACYEQSRIHALQEDFAAAKRLGVQSLELFRETQQIFNLVYVLNHLGVLCSRHDQEHEGWAFWHEALTIAEEQAHPLAAEIRQHMHNSNVAQRIGGA